MEINIFRFQTRKAETWDEVCCERWAEGTGSGPVAPVGGCMITWEETVLAAEGYNLSTLFYLLIICCVDSLFLCPPSPGRPPASPPESASCCSPACWEPVRCWPSQCCSVIPG